MTDQNRPRYIPGALTNPAHPDASPDTLRRRAQEANQAIGRAVTNWQREQLAKLRTRRAGFVTKEDLPEVIAAARLQPLIVRCGACRFTAPAQDVAHLIAIIEADGRDYIRDVSFPA